MPWHRGGWCQPFKINQGAGESSEACEIVAGEFANSPPMYYGLIVKTSSPPDSIAWSPLLLCVPNTSEPIYLCPLGLGIIRNGPILFDAVSAVRYAVWCRGIKRIQKTERPAENETQTMMKAVSMMFAPFPFQKKKLPKPGCATPQERDAERRKNRFSQPGWQENGRIIFAYWLQS